MPFLEAIIRDEDELKMRQQMRHRQKNHHKAAAKSSSSRPTKKRKKAVASSVDQRSVMGSKSASANGVGHDDVAMDEIESFPVEPENIDPASDISKRHSLPTTTAQLNRLSIQVSPNANTASSSVSASTAMSSRQSSMERFLGKDKKKKLVGAMQLMSVSQHL